MAKHQGGVSAAWHPVNITGSTQHLVPAATFWLHPAVNATSTFLISTTPFSSQQLRNNNSSSSSSYTSWPSSSTRTAGRWAESWCVEGGCEWVRRKRHERASTRGIREGGGGRNLGQNDWFGKTMCTLEGDNTERTLHAQTLNKMRTDRILRSWKRHKHCVLSCTARAI